MPQTLQKKALSTWRALHHILYVLSTNLRPEFIPAAGYDMVRAGEVKMEI